MNDAFNNPWTQIGLGILGASGPGTNAAQSIGSGGLMGLQNYQRQIDSQADRANQQRMLALQEQKMLQPDPTNIERMLIAAGMQPGTPEFQQAVMQYAMQPKQPLTSVNINNPGDKTWNETRAKSIEGSMNTLRQQATDSRVLQDRIERMNRLLSDPNFSTGPWEQRKFQIDKMMKGWGLDPGFTEKYSSTEQFVADSGEVVRQLLNQAKGPQTDQDRAFLQTIAPDIGKSTTANQDLVDYSQSRSMLDNIFADRYGRYMSQPSLEAATSSWTNDDALYRKLPASVQLSDGTIVHFKDVYRAGKKRGMSDDEILADWKSGAEGAK